MSQTPPSRPDSAPQASGQPCRQDPPTDITTPKDADASVLGERVPAERIRALGPASSTPREPVRVVGPGYRFNDRYVVERELGQGGMGKVYLARDDQLGRHVAVKVIRPQDPRLLDLTAHREEYARAFVEEAKVGAELDHPNIAKVFDFGIDHEEPFIVFEFVEGETLKDMLARRGRLPLEEAQDIVAALAQGLAYAHARHIVHRDLKPANIRITPGGQVKILDLGLAARFREEMDWRHCGTPTHIAPEQAAAQPCDGRTDQYALAVIAFELVTGQLPFSDVNVGVLLQQHLRHQPPDPRGLVPDLPEAVATAILRGLAKQLEDRFLTCDEFAVALGCQIIRQGPERPRFLRMATLTSTRGPRLSAPPRGFGSVGSVSLHLGLTSEGLYVCYEGEVTRWPLTAVMGATTRGTTLVVPLDQDGATVQTFTFAKKDSCEAFGHDIQQLLRDQPAGSGSDQWRADCKSVFLLPQRVEVAHQVLGLVSHQAKTQPTARAAVQLQGSLLGADAVTEVRVERLPVIARWRCSGVAVRAVEPEGRLEFAAHWLDQRAAALSQLMLLGMVVLWFWIAQGLLRAPKSGDLIVGGVIFIACSVTPLLNILLFRILRWPELAGPTAVTVFGFTLGMPLLHPAFLKTHLAIQGV